MLKKRTRRGSSSDKRKPETQGDFLETHLKLNMSEVNIDKERAGELLVQDTMNMLEGSCSQVFED